MDYTAFSFISGPSRPEGTVACVRFLWKLESRITYWHTDIYLVDVPMGHMHIYVM